ncbi:MAG: NUDIX hydrolase [Hyphomicrobiaceae bacterium]|nr:NUDIX hydrolase [Hyphomicrobiaceae bacterium]
MAVLTQIAALPYVIVRDEILVCLITSRGTQRWIIPKGWPKAKRPDYKLAAEEAREEAGLIGEVAKQPIGTYEARKRLHMFAIVRCNVLAFPLLVAAQRLNWREKSQRQVRWLPAAEAAQLVGEAGLAALIADLPKRLAVGGGTSG